MLAVISEIERGRLQLFHSEVVDLEIASAPDLKRCGRLQALIPHRHRYVRCEPQVSARALALEQHGFAGVDALHLALRRGGGRGRIPDDG